MKDNKNNGPAEPVGAARTRRRRFVAIAAVLGGLAVAGAAGLHHARRWLLDSPRHTDTPVRISLAKPPGWLPKEIIARVATQIQTEVGPSSIFEQDLARRVHEAAAKSPWIAQVRDVTKHRDGSICVEADFRRPFVLVRRMRVDAGPLVVVDEAGVVLPLRLGLLDLGTFITVDGVGGTPPEPGQKWDAPDLADGLRLVKLIRDKPYIREITTVDVRNHNGRISSTEPRLVMIVQVGQGPRTEIRFGQFPADELDYRVGPAQKLTYLDAIAEAKGGHLAGVGAYIELRYDRPYVAEH